MSSRDTAQLAAEHLRPFVESTQAQLYYPKEDWRAFKHWAVQEFLIDTELDPPEQELKDYLAIDGRSDLGLDGYIPDAVSKVLYLVQCKHHGSPKAVSNADIADFFEAMPKKLLSPDVVTASSNPMVPQAHGQLRDAIANGWTLVFVFVAAGWLTDEASKYVQANLARDEVLDSVSVRKELVALDWRGLEALYESHTFSLDFATDFDFDISQAGRHDVDVAGFKVVSVTLPAKELLSAYERYGLSLFRLNPRGPLGNTTANRDIIATLRDANSRKLFNLYNNGITAICDSWKIPPGSQTLQTRNFQIVNGCQTTVSLAKASAYVKADPELLVSMKVIESPSGQQTFAKQISNATNKQNRLSAEDFHSNDNIQLDLARQFAALTPPVFYETKRGEFRARQLAKQVDRFRLADGRLNYIEMKDVAQDALAFVGYPGVAKDRARSVFENDDVYARVFPPTVRAEQLLVCRKAYEAADAACETWKATFMDAPYARFVITALIGHALGANGELLTLSRARQVLGLGADFTQECEKAKTAVLASKLAAEANNTYRGPREYFRSEASYKAILQMFIALP